MNAAVAAYMIEAAVEIAKKQGFVPANENDKEARMITNTRDLIGSLWAIVGVLSWAGMILWLMYNWR